MTFEWRARQAIGGLIANRSRRQLRVERRW
jgi:hypothetical protein